MEDAARQQSIDESVRLKREEYQALKKQIESLLQNQGSLSEEQLVLDRDILLANVHGSSLTKNEKQELERLFKPFRDILADKREKALLALPEDDRLALLQLKDLFKQRKERRQEIKNQLESLRKAAGASC